MVGLFGDGLVDDVLFCCCRDSVEENLRWGETRVGANVFVGKIVYMC